MITIEQARTMYHEGDSAHDFEHILRVLRMAEKIAQAEGADLEIVRAAVLLHDVARADEDHGGIMVDHAELSAEWAHAFLLDNGESPAFADRVADAIRAHRFRGTNTPGALEGQVLFDADKLDAIGAIGIARVFAVAGALHQKLYAETGGDTTATRDQHNASHTPVAEFNVKLSKLRDRFHTATARKIAEERHRYMTEFFERLADEVRGDQ
ncbi:MAG: HD domain-containing protein [Anaerolineae bacterium]